MQSESFLLGFFVVYSIFLPFAALWGPAKISSDCDRLTKQLNRLRFEGDTAHKDRVAHLYNTLRDLNIQQGLGMRPPACLLSFWFFAEGRAFRLHCVRHRGQQADTEDLGSRSRESRSLRRHSTRGARLG